MKKKITISLGILFLIIFLILQFGIQIGNVRIGKQIDLKTKQDSNFEQSAFYKEYYEKDKLTVLNLWATWCQPCIEEMPLLDEVKSKYSKENINFISISVDNDSIKLVNFNKKGKFKFKDITLENLKYRNAILNTLDNRSPDKWISSYSVPVTYLIKNKKVVKKIDGTVEKQELIDLIEQNK
jgi:thiol-disulfide isomerase/thioredoxin